MLLQQLKILFLNMINKKDKQKSWHKQPASMSSHSSKLYRDHFSKILTSKKNYQQTIIEVEIIFFDDLPSSNR